jgi:hypothetical protein
MPQSPANFGGAFFARGDFGTMFEAQIALVIGLIANLILGWLTVGMQ